MKKYIAFIGIAAIIGITAYYENLYSPNDEETAYPYIPAVNEIDSEEEATAEIDPLEGLVPEIELKYISEKEEDGYLLETYREYEVYRDKHGQIVKSVGTNHYETLKYKK